MVMVMELDAAIKHLQDILSDPDKEWGCESCKQEHIDLLGFLLELKSYRELPKGDLISRSALLSKIDEERKYLVAREQLGAEHILVHNFQELAETAPSALPENNP